MPFTETARADLNAAHKSCYFFSQTQNPALKTNLLHFEKLCQSIRCISLLYFFVKSQSLDPNFPFLTQVMVVIVNEGASQNLYLRLIGCCVSWLTWAMLCWTVKQNKGEANCSGRQRCYMSMKTKKKLLHKLHQSRPSIKLIQRFHLTLCSMSS